MGISVVVITLNEAKKISECLESVSWADETVVVDSGSDDSTVELARDNGAKVFYRKFDDFSSQKNFAISKTSEEWVLSLDADEKITESLSMEIRKTVMDSIHNGYLIPRSNIIFGREMRYGGHQKDRHLRLFRKGKGKFLAPIHEKVKVEGSVGLLRSPILHYSTSGKNEYMEKLKLYTDLEAEFILSKGGKVSWQNLVLKPAAGFIKRYVFQKGFLDGREGFDFYFLSAYYDFVKYRKYFDAIKSRRLL